MRKNFSQFIFPAAFFVSSLGFAQTTNVLRIEVAGVPAVVQSQGGEFYGPPAPQYSSRTDYMEHHHRHHHSEPVDGRTDWFERCSNASREIIRARRDANFHAAHGRLAEATKIMKEAIARVADGDLSVVGRPAPGPHLQFAAEEAQKIIETSDQATSALPVRLKIQVDYLISSELIDVLKSAYEDLDNKYVRQMSNECGECWFDKLPREYFDGVRKLAVKFVDLQLKLQEVLASDLVELKMAKAIAISATNFLEVYTGRRAYCAALNDLLDLRDWICEYMERPDYPSSEMILGVCGRLRTIKNELDTSKRDCDCN